jgi:hypothetical protein
MRSTRWSKRHRYRGDVRLRRIGRKRSLSNLLFTDGPKTRFLGHHRERSRTIPAPQAFCEIRIKERFRKRSILRPERCEGDQLRQLYACAGLIVASDTLEKTVRRIREQELLT